MGTENAALADSVPTNPELLSGIVESTGEQASIGYWSFDPDSGEVFWSRQTFRILGYEPDEVAPTYDLFREALHDSQRDTFEMELRRAAKHRIPYVFEGTVTTRGGVEKRIRAMGRMRRLAPDRPWLLVGMIRDISDEHARQQTLGTALRWLETASEIARLGYWYLDVAHQSVEWSEEVYRIHGYEPGAFTPALDRAIDAYHPDDRERVAVVVRRGQETGEPWSLHARLVRADGEVRQVMASGRPMYDQDRLVALFGVIQDITAKEQRVANDRLFVSLVQQTPEGICVTDATGNCVWMNEAFEQLSGFSQDDMHGRRPGELLQGPETDPEAVKNIREALSAERSCTEDILNYRKDGKPYWVRLSIFPHRDQGGTLTHFMSIQTDITSQKETEARLAEQSRSLEESNFYLERQRAAAESMAEKDRQTREELEQAVAQSRKLQEELRHLAHYDELTGIPNRRYVLQRAAAEHKRARRYGRPMSVVMVDIDHFKSINDELGHAAGDKAICHVAQLLDEALRQGVDLCGRLGGEEFVLVLPETSLAGAVQVSERLRETLDQNPFGDGRPVHCSFGIADASEHDNVESAIKAADQKLYAAKQAGRNRVMF